MPLEISNLLNVEDGMTPSQAEVEVEVDVDIQIRTPTHNVTLLRFDVSQQASPEVALTTVRIF